jgi:20S proteasome alpha/beta subunit
MLTIDEIRDLCSCCGAGTAADCDKVTNMMKSQLELHRLNTGRQVRLCVANRLLKQYLFRYQGYVSAYLVLGGVDVTGPSLYNISANGYSDKIPFAAMGSGTLAAMSVLETRWKPDMAVSVLKSLAIQEHTLIRRRRRTPRSSSATPSRPASSTTWAPAPTSTSA